MKIYGVFVALIMCGIVVLYVFVGKLGGGEQYLNDKLLGLNYQSVEAIEHQRVDLALKYQNKALKALEEHDLPDHKAQWLSQRAYTYLIMNQRPSAEADYQAALQLKFHSDKTAVQLTLLHAALLRSEPVSAEFKALIATVSDDQVSQLDDFWQADYFLYQGMIQRSDQRCDEALGLFKKSCDLGKSMSCTLVCP